MRIAVCDDNQFERERFINILEKLSLQVSVPITFDGYENGKNMLFELDTPENYPAIIYLDINMPDMSGVQVASELRNRGYQGEIVFLTHTDNYWQPAFDVHAYHYIIKGDCSDTKFSNIFFSAVDSVVAKNEECMLFSSCGEVVSVPIKKIQYFEVINRVVTVYYGTDDKFEFYSTLSKLEEQLFNHGFVRIHKSYLVSASQIAHASYKEVLLRNNVRLPVGRAYQKNVKSIVGERYDAKEE